MTEQVDAAGCECGDVGPRTFSRRELLRLETINSRRRVTAAILTSDLAAGEQACAALANRSIDTMVYRDPLVGLYEVGATFPDIVVIGPTSGPFTEVDLVRTIRSREPDLALIVGVELASGTIAPEVLTAGASAVVTWPPNADALAAMMRSMAISTGAMDLGDAAIDLGRLRIDGGTPQIWVDGERIDLPPREFDLLRCLAMHVGLVVSREELVSRVWGSIAIPTSNTLTVHIRRLRHHLNDSDANPTWIRAFRGRGYQLNIPLSAAR